MDENKKKSPNEAAMEVVKEYVGDACEVEEEAVATPEMVASYTGVTCDDEPPQQDADDL